MRTLILELLQSLLATLAVVGAQFIFWIRELFPRSKTKSEAEKAGDGATVDAQTERPTCAEIQTEHSNVEPDKTDVEYEVSFATNRECSTQPDGSLTVSQGRGTNTVLGKCKVFVPKSHRIGSVGSPWWYRKLLRFDDSLRLLSTIAIPSDTFWGTVRRELVAKPGHAVVFIHGYNVTFEDAAIRAAQIGYDLQVGAGMFFFSWPSNGTLGGYVADSASLESSETAIKQFLIDVVEQSGAEAVHVIAHSMGNRALLRIVNSMVAHAEQQTQKPFSQIILAAPDVDRKHFLELAAAYAKVSQRTTMYVSSKDKAVGLSEWIHGYERAGFVPPITVLPGIDTVNVAHVDLSTFGHQYIAEARPVLQDMHELLNQNTEPDRRFALRRMESEAGAHWILAS